MSGILREAVSGRTKRDSEYRMEIMSLRLEETGDLLLWWGEGARTVELNLYTPFEDILSHKVRESVCCCHTMQWERFVVQIEMRMIFYRKCPASEIGKSDGNDTQRNSGCSEGNCHQSLLPGKYYLRVARSMRVAREWLSIKWKREYPFRCQKILRVWNGKNEVVKNAKSKWRGFETRTPSKFSPTSPLYRNEGNEVWSGMMHDWKDDEEHGSGFLA